MSIALVLQCLLICSPSNIRDDFFSHFILKIIYIKIAFQTSSLVNFIKLSILFSDYEVLLFCKTEKLLK